MTIDREIRIILTHGYTDSNKGDVAIALGTVTAIRQAFPNAVIRSQSIYSEARSDFKEHARFVSRADIPVREGILPSPYLEDRGSGLWHNLAAMIRLIYETISLMVLWFFPGLRVIHRRKALALEELKQADLVIARGGQYLHNESGRIRGLLYLSRMLFNIAVPVWLKRPTVILGLSLGPVYGRLARWLLKSVLSGCQIIAVRETLSADYLQTLGFTQNVRVVPDLAFLTTPSEPLNNKLPNRPCIGVTLVNWAFPGNPHPRQALANYLEAVFETLVKSYSAYQLVPVLVLQVTAQHHGQKDFDLFNDLQKKLRAVGIPAELVLDDLSPAEFSYLYGRCELVLATRLHSIILAACTGTPSVAIRYQGFKTQGIMQSLGLSPYTHDIAAVDKDALFNSVSDVIAHKAALRPQLQERVAGFQKQIMSVMAEIAAIL